MTAAPGPQLIRTEPRATSLKELPEALRSLWRAACPNPDGGDIARALTINFVGIAPSNDAGDLRAATERLLRRLPCRAFLLLLDDGMRGEVTAEVAATTRCSGSLRDIVLEEIVIRLPPTWFVHVPGLLRPLLMNDLPNHVFWNTGWPRDTRQFEAMQQLCEHSVVDSRRFVDPVSDLLAVATARRRGHATTDLSWLRLRPWRRAIAQAFERVRWTPGTPVTGTVRHGPRAAAAAILLADWLGAKLQARITREPTATGDTGNPELVDLRLPTHQVQILAEGAHVTVHVTANAFCHLPFSVPISRGSDGDLLAAAIDIA